MLWDDECMGFMNDIPAAVEDMYAAAQTDKTVLGCGLTAAEHYVRGDDGKMRIQSDHIHPGAIITADRIKV